jgi:hypothetical protein
MPPACRFAAVNVQSVVSSLSLLLSLKQCIVYKKNAIGAWYRSGSFCAGMPFNFTRPFSRFLQLSGDKPCSSTSSGCQFYTP